MSRRNDFFEIIQPEHLYAAAMFFGFITIVLVLLTYLYLYQKKKRHFTEEAIAGILDEWISEAILEEPEEYQHKHVTPELLDYFIDKSNRQFAINRLINTRKNLSGGAAQNIVRLYEQLDFKKDSLYKFYSRIWHKKARGIYELYMMQQSDMLEDVRKEANNKNEFVRMEAQTAIIGFEGFKGLSLLDNLTQPLNEWQQVKLLEQLDMLNAVEMEHLPLWLDSNNEYVVFFALRLVEIYQQFAFHDTVAQLLKSKNEKIERQAIVTLASIALPETPPILKEHYTATNAENKKEILKVLAAIGDDNELSFLVERTKENDDILKLEAVRGIIKCSIETDSESILNKLLGENLVPLTIIKQAQQENNR